MLVFYDTIHLSKCRHQMPWEIKRIYIRLVDRTMQQEESHSGVVGAVWAGCLSIASQTTLKSCVYTTE